MSLVLVCQTMMLSVLLLAGGCSSKSDDPTLSRTVKDAAKSVSQAAKTAGGNAWKLGQDTLSGIKSALGPEPEVAVETNSDEAEATVLSKAGETSCPSEGCDDDEDEDLKGHDFDLSVVDKEEGVLSQLYNIASSGVSTVYTTAKENIYDNGARLIMNFSKIVREIVHEELYVFLQTVLSSLGNSLLTPGTCSVLRFV